jgi:hypothetical protein
MNPHVRRILSLGLFVATVCLQGFAASTQGADKPSASQIVLRFDGVYQSEKTDNHYHYARFYADGTVITVSSTGTPQQVTKWFDRKKADIARGTYVITGTRIVFSTESKEGVDQPVDYDGRLKGETIEARVYSHINQYSGSHSLKFVEVEFPEE